MSRKYDVGVNGVWFGANYGSLLNGYATYKILKDLGYSVLMINKPNASANDWEVVNPHCLGFIQKFYPKESISELLPYSRLHELNNVCDTFLVGSDQIWHYNLVKGFDFTFLLNYVNDDRKKISFGTSFGHSRDFTPPDVLPKSIALMRRFDAISVREQSSADICRELYGVKADVIAEPVFCLRKEDYLKIAEKSDLAVPEPYILTYILDPTPKIIETIQYYSRITGMKAVNILDGNPFHNKKAREIFTLPDTLEEPGAEDLVALYANASFVITDSFHGSCFSIIFEKPFLAIANYKRGVARFQDMLKKYDLLDRLALDANNIPQDETLLQPVDFSHAHSVIADDRSRSIEWVKTRMEMQKDKMPSILLPKNVSQSLPMQRCTGCGACAAICPAKAIKMEPNEHGFLNPVVIPEMCTYCGLCTKKCISQYPVYKNISRPSCYAMMAKDDIRKVSSSGGMFTVAAEYVLGQGGYICGAALNEKFECEHIIVNNRDELYRLRGSKYIQSKVDAVYPKVRELLNENKLVLFTGMPCQVAGLYSYLGKEYGNLYTIDLLCHGITSQKVFDKYKKDVLETGDRKLTDIYFKAKEPWGWHPGINAYFSDGTRYSEISSKDPYYIAYLNSISKNTACEGCKVNCLPRQGDLTMGDFWGVSKYDPSYNDNRGTSVVLINNAAGEKFFASLKSDMKLVHEVPIEIAIAGNHCIESPYRLNKNSKAFFEYFAELPFSLLAIGCRDNELYKNFYSELIKKVPKEEHEFFYLAKIVAKNAHGRKIVTWIRSERFETVLKKYFGLSVAFGVSMRKEALKENEIYDFNVLKGQQKQYYLVSLDRAYDDEIYRTLNSIGYTELKDFVFRRLKPIVIENLDLSKGNYYDSYGNTIEGWGATIGKVVMKGFNNHIILGKNLSTAKNLSISLTANTYVEIGNNTRFNAATHIECIGNEGFSKVIIGENCRFLNSLFRLYNDMDESLIAIGDLGTFETNLDLHANSGKKLIIGRDCMASHNVHLWAGDGHSIFNVRTGKNINSVSKNQESYRNKLIIGEHVWIAYGTFVMHGTDIGNGSILGAQSVVKGKFPNNCSIGGNPARIIRKDIAWSRDMQTEDIRRCGREEYVSLTYDDMG